MAKVITLSGLGKQQSCCRWIWMLPGYWAYVCGPGLCSGGDAAIAIKNGTARIVATNNTPSLLGSKAPVQTFPLPVNDAGFTTGFDFGAWIKEYWYIPAAVAAFFIFKK